MIQIDPEPLLGDLDSLRRICGCNTGVVRQALTTADIEARRWLADRMEAAIELAASPARCSIAAQQVSAVEPTLLDRGLIDALHAASPDLAMPRCGEMVSGALHDAGVVARVLPSAMLFVPSAEGWSHRFDEDTPAEQLITGAAVTAAAVARLQACRD